ncbi:Peptidase S8, subtilisin-related [Carpediemonas membranifera]|uniref:Peptidase S8, subtilisin-related n=1 Tax=Carpediemonas membranifera TaxID=201153 RepID=A0A8J6E7K7_9EUKA|nr:Peptidase S8, subtilisin-related [Carpediemonas membranifera]|eukprot:KAG9390820.1 Peptidase S8, subtilisin-related [Carpediemonas membranifera]
MQAVILAALLIAVVCHLFDQRSITVTFSELHTHYTEQVIQSGCSLVGITPPSGCTFICETFNETISALPFVAAVEPPAPVIYADPVITDASGIRPIGSLGIHRDVVGQYAHLDTVDHIVLSFHRSLTDEEVASFNTTLTAALVAADMPPALVERHFSSGIVLGFTDTPAVAAIPTITALDLPLLAAIAQSTLAESDNAYASASIQGMASSTQATVNMHNPHPLWDLGVDGTGIVVGVGDTGMAHDHCMFYDDAVPFQNDTYQPNHRKIVYYDTSVTGDNVDGNGHGSHVVGSILGSPSDSTDPGVIYQGMAPGAKAYFIDLGAGSGSGLTLPSNLFLDYFDPAYSKGATVMSSSWSSSLSVPGPIYYLHSYNIDLAAYVYRNLTILTSAGNNAMRYGPWSIAQEGLSKNAITVGASTSGYDAMIDLYCHNTTSVMAACRDEVNWNCTAKCGSLSVVPPVFPMIGSNSVADFSAIGGSIDKRIKPDIVAPGYYIISANSSGSTGLTCDMDNDFRADAGTSMATPVAAGGVALLQDFISRGMHYDGRTPNNTAAFFPSSALVRATLIASAQSMDGKFYMIGSPEYMDLSNLSGWEPNNFRGWGRMGLYNLIKSRLILKDEEDLPSFTTDRTEQHFTFDVTAPGHTLDIAMSWIDPPAATPTVSASTFYSTSTSFPTAHTLVLWVKSPSGKFFTGNVPGEATYFDEDVINLNHRVHIDEAESGAYSIWVTLRSSLFVAQPVALAVMGQVDPDSWSAGDETLPACVGGCGVGSCVNDACVCPGDFFGPGCASKAPVFSADASSFTIPAGGITIAKIYEDTVKSLDSYLLNIESSLSSTVCTQCETGMYVNQHYIAFMYDAAMAELGVDVVLPNAYDLNENRHAFDLTALVEASPEYPLNIKIYNLDPFNNLTLSHPGL